MFNDSKKYEPLLCKKYNIRQISQTEDISENTHLQKNTIQERNVHVFR